MHVNDMPVFQTRHPLDDPLAYRRCLGQFTTGVTAITTEVDGERHGVTANSFTSVSLEPPLVLWSISRKSRSFDAFERAGHFAVNILAATQVDVSGRFASSKIDDKFAGVDWTPGRTGIPVIRGAVATLECRTASRIEGGDHLILMGEVLGFRNNNREPLIFSQGQYGVPADHPSVRLSSGFRAPGGDGRPLDSFVSGLMYRAYASMSAALEKVRADLGLTHMEARLMTAIETFPASTIETLAPELLMGLNASRHVRDALVERGLIALDDEEVLHLTERGRRLFATLIDNCRTVEAEMLRGLGAEDLAANRKVLTTLIERSA